MTVRIAVVLAAVLLGGSAPAQQQEPTPDRKQEVRLPNGKRQSDEILRAEHKKSLEDAAELVKLTEDLKAELEKNDAFVLSLGAIKKTEDIEKVARRIRSRLKRF